MVKQIARLEAAQPTEKGHRNGNVAIKITNGETAYLRYKYVEASVLSSIDFRRGSILKVIQSGVCEGLE